MVKKFLLLFFFFSVRWPPKNRFSLTIITWTCSEWPNYFYTISSIWFRPVCPSGGFLSGSKLWFLFWWVSMPISNKLNCARQKCRVFIKSVPVDFQSVWANLMHSLTIFFFSCTLLAFIYWNCDSFDKNKFSKDTCTLYDSTIKTKNWSDI